MLGNSIELLEYIDRLLSLLFITINYYYYYY